MRERVLALGVRIAIGIAALLELGVGLQSFGVGAGTLHWPDVGRFAAGGRRVSGEEVYEPLRAALANAAQDGVHVVLADDANLWTWVSYLTYPRTWRYAPLRGANAVVPTLSRDRLRIVAELPGLDGPQGEALVRAFASSLRGLVGDREVVPTWSSISSDRVLVVFEVAP